MSYSMAYRQPFELGRQRQGPRIHRACDTCRRRKTKCDGPQLPGVKCPACIDANRDCTYLEGRRASSKTTYLESLEARLEHSEARLEHSEAQLENAEALVRQLRAELASVAFAKSTAPDSSAVTNTAAASLHIMRVALYNLTGPPRQPHADDLQHLELQRKLEKISLGVDGGALPPTHFVGKSSHAVLLKAAIELKADVENTTGHVVNDKDASSSEDEHDIARGHVAWTSRRLEYWTFKPWENTPPRAHAYSFPPSDLTTTLIELYFLHVNVYLPLLHRPTFEKGVAAGLHYRDDGFAATLLLVCAVASRWSTDPCVMLPYETEGSGVPKPVTGRLACGWRWFDQVPLGKSLVGQARLYDLQYYCLAVQFLEGSPSHQAGWTLLGVGLRLAQDVGAHRRTSRVERPSVEGELWKRAFWVLVYMDRFLSASMGRTPAMHHDDFDLDRPIECDDEYWEHPTHPFQQPPGVPSHVAMFNALLRLNDILAFSAKNLYSLTNMRAILAIDDAWEEHIVAELDSALNRWRDEVPEHLRWDPAREDRVFFDQSVALHCAYFNLQILIHRPFIPMVRNSAPTARPSLAICTSAARTCANMVDVQRRRKENVPVAFNLPAVFTSGIVLLLNVWSGKRAGLVPDPSREIANVHKCMEVIRLCEDRWQYAGLVWDILYELASVGQLPLPNPTRAGIARNDLGVQANVDLTHMNPPIMAPNLPYDVEPIPFQDKSRIMVGMHETLDPSVSASQFAPYIQPMPEHALHDVPLFGSRMGPSSFGPISPPDAWLSPKEPVRTGHELDDLIAPLDSDMIAMWANAPSGIEADDWGNYFSNFKEIATEQQMMHGGDAGMHGR